MATQFLLGLDAGTSVVKAALFDRQGHELATTARPTTLITPHPGWAEASMSETWDMAVSAIRETLRKSKVSSEQIAAVGITGNMVGAWLIDSDGEPVRNAILWCDGRSQSVIDRLSVEKPGFMSRIFDSAGSVMQQGCTLPVLRWLADHEPQALQHAKFTLCCKDWIAYKLTGSIQIDPTEASVMPGSARQRGYDQHMIELHNLQMFQHLFPPIRASEEVIGVISEEAARLTGLRAGTPVVAGAGDVPASAIGVGAVEPGIACSLLGTNFLNCVVVGQPLFEPHDVGGLFCLPGGNWLRAMINVSGTTSLDWAVEQFFRAEKERLSSTTQLFAYIEQSMNTSTIGARGLIYLPYLSGQGITAPFLEPAARAEFFGLANYHTRADLMRAVYEGLALSVRDGYNVIPVPVDEIHLSGGASKSDFFCQMIADCTGKQVTVPAGSEFGAKGAALLAAVGIGLYDAIQQAVKSTASESGRVFTPEPELKPVYDELYTIYCQLRDALIPVWRRNLQRTNID